MKGLHAPILATVMLAGLLVSPSPAAAQDGTPSLTTEDVTKRPDSWTNQNATVETAKAADDAAKAESPAKAVVPVAKGYARVVTGSGYHFDRPEKWTAVQDLEAKGAPSFFKYDAIFQDPKSGAVVSAISVDAGDSGTPIDLSDEGAVDSLLTSMLNPAKSKDGIKIFRRLSGTNPDGSKWLRVKAQGNGQAVDGSVVDTTFWIQFVQSGTKLALVAVGYPTAQQDTVAQAAFHTVRTLEMEDGSGTAAPERQQSGAAGSGKKGKEKDGKGDMREQ